MKKLDPGEQGVAHLIKIQSVTTNKLIGHAKNMRSRRNNLQAIRAVKNA